MVRVVRVGDGRRGGGGGWGAALSVQGEVKWRVGGSQAECWGRALQAEAALPLKWEGV